MPGQHIAQVRPALWRVIAFAPLVLALPGYTLQGEPNSGKPIMNAGPSIATWRCKDHEGLNCLFLQLALLGHPIGYDGLQSLAADIPDVNSINGLKVLAARAGVVLRPVELTYDQLVSLAEPAIVFLEPQGIGTGSFALVVDASPKSIEIVDGSAVIWQEPNTLDFRRAWSGYALVAQPSESFVAVVRRYCLLPALLYVFLKLGIRFAQRKGQHLAVIGRRIGSQITVAPLVAWLLLFITAGATSVAGATATQPTTLPDGVREALLCNARDLTPLTVSWVHELKPMMSPDELSGQAHIPLKDQTDWFSRYECRSIIEADLLSTRLTRRLASSGAVEVLEYSFDGTDAFIGRPNGRGTDGLPYPTLSKWNVGRMAQEQPNGMLIRSEYLTLAGFAVQSTAIELWEHALPRSTIVKQLDEGASLAFADSVVADGRQLFRVEYSAVDPDVQRARNTDAVAAREQLEAIEVPAAEIEARLRRLDAMRALPEVLCYIWLLDPQLAYAVCRYEERRPDGSVVLVGENDDFTKVEQRGVYLPRRCRVTYYTRSGLPRVFEKPLFAMEAHLESVGTDSTNRTSFTLEYTEPGTCVFVKPESGQSSFQLISADAATLRQAVNKTADFAAGDLTSPSDRGDPLRVLRGAAYFGVAITLIAIIGKVLRHVLARQGNER